MVPAVAAVGLLLHGGLEQSVALRFCFVRAAFGVELRLRVLVIRYFRGGGRGVQVRR